MPSDTPITDAYHKGLVDLVNAMNAAHYTDSFLGRKLMGWVDFVPRLREGNVSLKSVRKFEKGLIRLMASSKE